MRLQNQERNSTLGGQEHCELYPTLTPAKTELDDLLLAPKYRTIEFLSLGLRIFLCYRSFGAAVRSIAREFCLFRSTLFVLWMDARRRVALGYPTPHFVRRGLFRALHGNCGFWILLRTVDGLQLRRFCKHDWDRHVDEPNAEPIVEHGFCSLGAGWVRSGNWLDRIFLDQQFWRLVGSNPRLRGWFR